ncbi:MAG: hypothetical protein F6K62_09530 [Sphaerospermopsis sp. SIO1G2]|nr:hypothetical protein [Sphaerospermopsis sp. SIO1G1]NET71149.1 hypothetical protein [Sphaerospermopsis sp. SIO1G2]
MVINFFAEQCQSQTNQIKFGICDDPSPSKHPAYIDKENSHKWIAIVENNQGIAVVFTAIDNCIEILRPDGKMSSRCDCMLTYDSKIIFVELKERNYKNSEWIEDGDRQLRKTIEVFKHNYDLTDYKSKKAYIANRKKPHFQYSHKERMQKFRNDTGVRLSIENIIRIP